MTDYRIFWLTEDKNSSTNTLKLFLTWSVWWRERFLGIFTLAFLLFLAFEGGSNPAGNQSYCENAKKPGTPPNRPGPYFVMFSHGDGSVTLNFFANLGQMIIMENFDLLVKFTFFCHVNYKFVENFKNLSSTHG